MIRKKGMVRHIVELFSGTAINMLVGVLTTPIITRLVSPDAYGQLSIFNLYDSIIVMVFCLGLDQALIRFYYRDDSVEYRRSLIRNCAVFPCIILLIFGIAAILLFSLNIITFEMGLYAGISLLIYSFFQLLRRFSFIVLRLEYQSRVYSILHIVQKVVYVLCAVLLLQLIKGYDFLVLAWSTILSVLVVTVVSMLAKRMLWAPIGKSNNIVKGKELLRFGIPFILSMGLTTLFQGIDQFSLKYYCDFYEIGVYSSAMSIIHIFALVQTTFNAFWSPLATEHYQKNHNENKQFYVTANDYICIVMFFIGIGLVFFKDVFALLLGSDYRAAAYVIPCLIFNPIMLTVSETTAVGINISKKSYLHIITSLIACVVNIIGNMILVPILGGRGAAISTGISYIIFFIFRTLLSVKQYPVPYKIGKIGIMTAVLLAYTIYNTFFEFNIITILGGIVCLIVWLVVYKSEIISMIKNLKVLIRKKQVK